MFLLLFLPASYSLGRLPNLKGQSGHFADGHCLTSWALPHIQSIHFALMLFNGVMFCPPRSIIHYRAYTADRWRHAERGRISPAQIAFQYIKVD